MKRNYLVVFAKCKGSNFSGHAPDVPGCVSVGDTLEEMVAMMREALEFHLETMVEHGERLAESVTTFVEFKRDDFDDVEYFVVQQLEINVPTASDAAHPTTQAHQAA